MNEEEKKNEEIPTGNQVLAMKLTKKTGPLERGLEAGTRGRLGEGQMNIFLNDSTFFLQQQVLKASKAISANPKHIKRAVNTTYWYAVGTKDQTVDPYFGRGFNNKVTFSLFRAAQQRCESVDEVVK